MLKHIPTHLIAGPLGAGKTCLVRGIAEGLGVPTDLVASPTFVPVHEYAGRLPPYPADLYRLEEQDAVNGLGLEEYTETPGVTVIEWADKAPGVLPRDHLWITLDHLGGDRRLARQGLLGPRFGWYHFQPPGNRQQSHTR